MSNFNLHQVIKLADVKKSGSLENLKVLLSTPNTLLAINVPCPNLDYPRWHIDIAHDYLAALVVGETLAQYCKNIKAYFEGLRTVFFVFNTQDIINLEEFIDKLLWLGKLFFVNNFDDNNELEDDDYDDNYEELRNAMEEIADNIDTLQLNFPELGDMYMANAIPGEQEISGDDTDFDALNLKYPERQYEFWRSCVSNNIGFDFYLSGWSWLIPHDLNNSNIHRNLESLLTKFGGFVDGIPSLKEAQCVTIGNLPSIVFNEDVMACYPSEGVRQAQECAISIWNMRLREKIKYSNEEAMKKVHNIAINNFSISANKINIKLSEDGYILVVSDFLAQYVFFKEKYFSFLSGSHLENLENDFLDQISSQGKTLWEIPIKSQNSFWKGLDRFSETLGNLEGNPINIKLNWNDFDDDSFEQLCYDIIRMSENFDPETARKMGNSRSRDGGRDIEIFTRQRINTVPKKWIIQCKFSKSSKSLSASKVSISDVIDEYGVQGFCVMTNTLIDSTLHDRLERISQNRCIEFDEWDILRIERTLSRPRYRNIRKRYFEN